MTTDLARLGAPPAILGMAARVIEDEVRHVEVCLRVLGALGANTAATPAEGTRIALDADATPPTTTRAMTTGTAARSRCGSRAR